MRRLLVRNHRGRDVPAVLGFVLVAGGLAATAAVAVGAGRPIPSAGWIASGAALLVFAAGLIDDLLGGSHRGLRGHLRALASGHVTTGIVKLLVITGAAAVAVGAAGGGSAATRIARVVLVAGAANLWNGLDVRPGRALKFSLPILLTIGAVPWIAEPFIPGVALAVLLLLPWDVGERAMLGDAGANLLGFSVGLHLSALLSPAWTITAAASVVVLNLLAEMVTLSRLIDAVPPLRWFDRLGTPGNAGD